MKYWKDELHEKLLDAFVAYQWRVEHPFPSTQETEEQRILAYRSDPIFHNKVESLTCGVMDIICNVLDGKINDT